MSERSSDTLRTALAFLDLESQSWRMSQGCLLSVDPELLVRLPPWGTTVNGVLFERRMPEQLIAVRDGSVLLGTPRAAQGDASVLLPTPAANDGSRGPDASRLVNAGGKRPSGASGTVNLHGALNLLPTPAVNDMGAGKTIEWWDEWSARQKASDGRPAPHGKSLSIEAQRLTGEECQKLLPTPTQRDYKDTGDLKRTVPNDDSLLPRAIAHHVTGGDTPLPLNDGNKPSDDQHHPQPTPKD